MMIDENLIDIRGLEDCQRHVYANSVDNQPMTVCISAVLFLRPSSAAPHYLFFSMFDTIKLNSVHLTYELSRLHQIRTGLQRPCPTRV